MNRKLKKLIAEMTLEEKAGLCSGLDNWSTKPIERLGIPAIKVADGPHGLRKQDSASGDHLGLGVSLPATCFPAGVTLASSWDVQLMEKVGESLGKECQTQDVQVLLGPALNIKRSPLCGRNFEYYSEDPYLSGELAAAFINGVQSQGVGTSVKHYAVNNQEHRRMSVNAVVDERTLREIYLPGFEGAVKQANPWTIMAAYNKVNGTYASEHQSLLTEILRDDWGFEGFVVSDWGAVNDRVDGLAAGLELEMPGNGGRGDQKIVESVRNGKVSEETLDLAVERILSIVFKAMDNRKPDVQFDAMSHHQLARSIASECMVLLKNDDGILPLKNKKNVAVIGEMAMNPRFQGGGSSHIAPTKVDIPFVELQELTGKSVDWSYFQGYELANDNWNEELADKAVDAARNAEVAIVFAGLPDRYESEGYDRHHMRLPENHNRLIQAIADVQPNLIVVLSNGSPVELPWVNRVKAILETYLGGQASGGAIADLLLGVSNPSGKLAETFPLELRNNPSYFNFPGEGDVVVYREGLMVGYRYYDTQAIKPLFAFGHGLSYTTFEYKEISLEKSEISDKDSIRVGVTVRNVGKLAGKETIQLYVRDVKSSKARPEKELKGFSKVYLEPGEEKTIEFILDMRSFAYYNTNLKDWHVETGEFEIMVGGASDQIELITSLLVRSTVGLPPEKLTKNSLIESFMVSPIGEQVLNSLLSKFLEGNNEAIRDPAETYSLFMNLPITSLSFLTGGAFSEDMVEDLVVQINEAQGTS